MSGDIDWCADPDNYWLIRYVFGDKPNFVMYARLGDDEARCVWYIPVNSNKQECRNQLAS